MIVEIDDTSHIPPYEQLRSQVVTLVSSGALTVGTRLPTVRGLAGDLGLSPGTVARAYRELERDGTVETRGRHGTFVAAAVRLSEQVRESQLDQMAQEFAARVHALAVPLPRAIQAVEAALQGLLATSTGGPGRLT
ncbi:MAG: GntR family transcriptional regulator [Mycobacteriales bacterium]